MDVNPLDALVALELRVGTVTRAQPHPTAHRPAIQLWIDFGPPPHGLGEKTSSAQLTQRYQPDELVGRQVVAAVNLGERRIGGFKSQVLVLGVPDDTGRVVLLRPDASVPPGGRVY